MLIEAGPIVSRRVTVKKTAAWLHLWLGLASGLIVFIVSLTGCIYVFEKEIKSVVYADRLYVAPAASAPLPLSVLLEKAQAALGPDRPVQRARIHNGPDRSYVFGSFKGNPAGKTYFGQTVYNYNVYLDPYDGKILKVENTELEFFSLVLWLHYSLLLSTKIGQPIVGTAVLVFVVLLVSGLVLWWPRHRAALKARLRVSWRAKWKRLNWDLHSVLGFYASAIALLVALTGLVWAFKWFDNGVYYAITGGAARKTDPPAVSDTSMSAAARPLDAVFAKAIAATPGYREMFISWPEKRSGVISTFARSGDYIHYRTHRMQFDRYSGSELKSKGFEDMDRGEKLKAMNYDLHVGAILGMPGKILAFLASLICTTLPVTGLLIWLAKKGRKRRGIRTPGVLGSPARAVSVPER